MARYKSTSKKTRLTKQGKHTKWAPFWAVLKAYGKGKRVHPSSLTKTKRSWRRDNINTNIKNSKIIKPRTRKVEKKY